MIYDYKSDELIQDVVVECLYPVVTDIIDEYSTLRRDEYILMYVPVYLAVEIMNRFLEEVEESHIDPEANIGLLTNDDNEVILTFSADGTVYVEEARGCHHIKDAEGSVLAYVYDDFTKNDVDIISKDEYSVLVFGFEDDFELDIDDDALVEVAVDDEGEIHGFNVSKNDDNSEYSCTFYSSDGMDEDTLLAMLKIIGF